MAEQNAGRNERTGNNGGIILMIQWREQRPSCFLCVLVCRAKVRTMSYTFPEVRKWTFIRQIICY